MAFTYTTLKTAIQNYLEESETSFVGNLDVFIKQAEDRILKDVQLPVFRKIQTTTISSNTRFLSLPSDFLAQFSLAAKDGSDNYTWLLKKEPEFINEAYPDDSGSTQGTPRFYGVWDHDSFILGPRSDTTYTMELHYFYRPTSIVDAVGGTSWLGTNAEMCLLNACLLEAYTYLKGESDLLELYNKRYEAALARLKNLGEGMRDRDTYRKGAFSIEVS